MQHNICVLKNYVSSFKTRTKRYQNSDRKQKPRPATTRTIFVTKSLVSLRHRKNRKLKSSSTRKYVTR
jgi:hypothetical protein